MYNISKDIKLVIMEQTPELCWSILHLIYVCALNYMCVS